MRSQTLSFLLSFPLALLACNKSQEAASTDGAKSSDGAKSTDGSGDSKQADSGSPGAAKTCPGSLTGDIVEPVIINKDCGEVLVDGSVQVHADLTLEAGATLVVSEGAEIAIGDHDKPGRLLVKGTAEAPVTIAGKTKAPGSWAGIRLMGAASLSNIDHLTLQDAGADDAPALLVSSPNVTIGAVTVRASKGPAVELALDEPTPFASLTVDGVGAPALRSTARGAGGLVAVAGAGAEAHIVSGDFQRDSKLAAIGVPWVITYDAQVGGDESTPAVLTVAAGADLRFTESGALTVGLHHTGKLVFAGEAGKPIKLGSNREPQAGAWRGVEVRGHGTLEAKHVELRDAGRDEGAAIDVPEEGRATLSDLAISNSTIGVRSTSNIATLAVTNTGFTAVPVALQLAPETLGGVGAGNRYDADARIVVVEGTVARDITWASQATTIELQGNLSVDKGKLVIPSGKVRVADGVTIAIGMHNGATLELKGTAEQPVELAGLREEPGLWGPITIYGTVGTRAVIEHVILSSVAGPAGLVVEDEATAKIDNLRCDRCEASLQWSCAAKVEQTNVSAGTDTATAVLAPEGC